MAGDLIPIRVRLAIREAMGNSGRYPIDEIGKKFRAFGFKPTTRSWRVAAYDHRLEVARFDETIDWSSPEQSGRYLQLVEQVLDELNGYAAQTDLQRVLKRSEITTDPDGRLYLPASAIALMSIPDAASHTDIRLHADRLADLDAAPEELIGAAKDLVEATAKHVLIAFGETIPKGAKVPQLSKAALLKLGLHPESIAPTVKGAEVVKGILTDLAGLAVGIAELRNLGYGVGHGQGVRVQGLKKLHGELAARAAVAYASTVLDALYDAEAPWQRVSVKTSGLESTIGHPAQKRPPEK